MLTRNWYGLNRDANAIDEIHRRMNRLFNEFNHTETHKRRFADARFYDQGEALVLALDAPGFTDKDIELTLEGDVLTIKGERKEDKPEGYALHRRERGTLRFHRGYTLPVAVDSEKAEASVKDGELKVILPKAESALPKRINIG